jgi:hypothetical protein
VLPRTSVSSHHPTPLKSACHTGPQMPPPSRPPYREITTNACCPRPQKPHNISTWLGSEVERAAPASLQTPLSFFLSAPPLDENLAPYLQVPNPLSCLTPPLNQVNQWKSPRPPNSVDSDRIPPHAIRFADRFSSPIWTQHTARQRARPASPRRRPYSSHSSRRRCFWRLPSLPLLPDRTGIRCCIQKDKKCE